MVYFSEIAPTQCSRKRLDTQRSSHSAAASGGGCGAGGAPVREMDAADEGRRLRGLASSCELAVLSRFSSVSPASLVVGRAPTPPLLGKRDVCEAQACEHGYGRIVDAHDPYRNGNIGGPTASQ